MTTTQTNQARWIATAGSVVIAIYVAISAYNYFSPALAADEIAYFVWASEDLDAKNSQGFLGPLYRTNLSAYGSTYWTIYENLIVLLGRDAVWGMRLIAFMASMSIPIALIRAGNRTHKSIGWLVAALWLTMPVAWWSGKISGPETQAMACVVHAILLLHLEQPAKTETNARSETRRCIAWFLLGFAVAFKLTMLPALVFAFLVSFPLGQPTRPFEMLDSSKRLIQIGFSTFIGFVVGCPSALFATREFIAQLKATPSGAPWDGNIAVGMLNSNGWTWDGVFSGGLIQWCCAPVVLALLGATMLTRHRILIASAVAFLVCWGILASKGAMLGWYWFGWIATIVPAVLWMYQRTSGLRWISAAVVVAVLTNGLLQYKIILNEIQSKQQQVGAIAALPKLNVSINELLANEHFDLILDHSEVTYKNGLQFENAAASEIVQTSPPGVWKLSENWDQIAEKATKSELARDKRGVLSNVFEQMLKLSERGTEGKSILILMSRRLSRGQPFQDIDNFIFERVVAKSPDGTIATRLLDLPYTNVYAIRTTVPLKAE